MIDRKLLLRLVFPLVIIALIGIVLIWPPHLDDLINNLIVEIAGILITVLFVDWIIKTREHEKWEQVDVLIRADFAAWSPKFIAETTMFLSNGGVTLPESAKFKSPDKPWGFALEYVSFEDIHSALFDTDIDDRESFVTSLQQKLEDLLRLYARYSNRLSAEDIKAILELEGILRPLINEMSLIDDETVLLNLAEGDPARVDSVWTKHIENAANRLKEAITQSIQIFGEFFPLPK